MLDSFSGTLSPGHRESKSALGGVTDGWRRHPVLWTGSVALLLVSATWTVLGFYYLIFSPSPTDIHFRWIEQRYVYNGQNPYDVVELVAAQRDLQPLPECTRDNRVDPRIGTPYHRQGGYPPWAFPTTALFVLPTGFLLARLYFSVLNLLALALTFVWAYQIGRSHSRAGGVFLAAAALAVFGHFKALDVGQYSILINALLIGVYFLMERQKPVLAGVVYGMAALKPQISALFAIIFLVRRQWKSLLAATTYVVIASLLTWAVTKTNPVEMLAQMQHLAWKWTYHPDAFNLHLANPPMYRHPQGNSSISTFLMEAGVEWEIATPLASALGLLATGAIVWLWRNAPTLTLFAVVATIGRLWSYHLPYDNVMLIFLVVALGKLVLIRPSLGTVLAFSLVGILLWIPVRSWSTAYPLPLEIAQVSSWLFGVTVLLASQPRALGRKEPLNLSAVPIDHRLLVSTIAGQTGLTS